MNPARSLLLRVSLPVGLLLSLLCVAGIAAWSQSSENSARIALQLKAELTAGILAQAAAEAVWNFDKDGAATVLRAAAADPDYAGSEIVDAGDNLFCETVPHPDKTKAPLSSGAQSAERLIADRLWVTCG